jgi:hypothetical protein
MGGWVGLGYLSGGSDWEAGVIISSCVCVCCLIRGVVCFKGGGGGGGLEGVGEQVSAGWVGGCLVIFLCCGRAAFVDFV